MPEIVLFSSGNISKAKLSGALNKYGIRSSIQVDTLMSDGQYKGGDFAPMWICTVVGGIVGLSIVSVAPMAGMFSVICGSILAGLLGKGDAGETQKPEPVGMIATVTVNGFQANWADYVLRTLDYDVITKPRGADPRNATWVEARPVKRIPKQKPHIPKIKKRKPKVAKTKMMRWFG